jgi:hypothetical protein
MNMLSPPNCLIAISNEARAGRILLENHAKRVPGKRRVCIRFPLGPAGTRRLAVHGVVDHRRNGVRACIG